MCDLDYDDGDAPSVWSERLQKARKPYRCVCCHAPIAVGEQYLYHFSVSDGLAWTERMCKACDEIRDQFGKEHGDQMPAPSNFRDSLVNCIDERDEESLK